MQGLQVSWLPPGTHPAQPDSRAQGKTPRGEGDLPRRKGISEIQEQVGPGPVPAPRAAVNKYLLRTYYIEIDIYTLICIKWITNKNLLYKKIK